MANFNKVILAGNLTRDPQLKYLPNETPIVEFGMAINRRWNSPDGQKREEVCYVDLTAFGKQAETINHYMKKGQPILIEGQLKYHQWQAQDGSKRNRLTVTVETFQFLGGPQGAGQQNDQPSARPAYRSPANNTPPPDNIPEPEEDIPQSTNKEDIPF